MLSAIEERRKKREKEEIGISEDQVPAIWALEDALEKIDESLDFLNGNILT